MRRAAISANRAGGTDKPIVWLGGEIKTPPFGTAARKRCGRLLREAQEGIGLSLPLSHPMPIIANGAHELRLNDATVTWRIVYYIGRKNIFVLDVFQKKTETTPANRILLCQNRLFDYLRNHKEE